MLELLGTRARQPRLTTVSKDMTHPTRFAPLTPRPGEVCPIYWIGTIGQNHNSENCITVMKIITANLICYKSSLIGQSLLQVPPGKSMNRNNDSHDVLYPRDVLFEQDLGLVPYSFVWWGVRQISVPSTCLFLTSCLEFVVRSWLDLFCGCWSVVTAWRNCRDSPFLEP